jgi:hypothetical protein
MFYLILPLFFFCYFCTFTTLEPHCCRATRFPHVDRYKPPYLTALLGFTKPKLAMAPHLDWIFFFFIQIIDSVFFFVVIRERK